jgi:hypothetical protein
MSKRVRVQAWSPIPRPFGLGVPGLWSLEALDEGVLHTEDGLADLQLGIVFGEDVCDQGAVARGGHHEVHVCGANR